MIKDLMSVSFLPRLLRLGLTFVLGIACVCLALGIAWLSRPSTLQVHAAGCPYLGFSPNSGYVGMSVTISGAVACEQGSAGQTATLFVMPGDNTTNPGACENPPIRVDVGTVTVVAQQWSYLTFNWPSQASQLGVWSACASVMTVDGTQTSTWASSLFTVVAAPTPTATPPATPRPAPRPMPTETASPTAPATATAAATATATPLATTTLSQHTAPTSDRPLPWGLVLGGTGAVAGAFLLSLGGAFFVRRRRLRL